MLLELCGVDGERTVHVLVDQVDEQDVDYYGDVGQVGARVEGAARGSQRGD